MRGVVFILLVGGLGEIKDFFRRILVRRVIVKEIIFRECGCLLFIGNWSSFGV